MDSFTRKKLDRWVRVGTPMEETLRSLVEGAADAKTSVVPFTVAESRIAGTVVGLFVSLYAKTVEAKRSVLEGGVSKREAKRLLEDLEDQLDALEPYRPVLNAAIRFAASFRRFQFEVGSLNDAVEDAVLQIDVDLEMIVALDRGGLCFDEPLQS